MAHLIPPHGPNPTVVLTREEALMNLAILNANATYANRPIREVLLEYINRLPTVDE